MTPPSSRPDISRPLSAPLVPTTSSLLFDSEFSNDYDFDTGYTLQARSLTQSPEVPYYARPFAYEPMMVEDSFVQYPEDADLFKEPPPTVEESKSAVPHEADAMSQRVIQDGERAAVNITDSTMSSQPRELDVTTTQTAEIPLPPTRTVPQNAFECAPEQSIQQVQPPYAQVNPPVVVSYAFNVPTRGSAYMHHQLVYPVRPVSFQMRYGDMVALLQRVHEEYRERQASEETDADVTMGELRFHLRCHALTEGNGGVGDEASVSSVESASIQTPEDSPVLSACAYTPSKIGKSEVASLEYSIVGQACDGKSSVSSVEVVEHGDSGVDSVV